MRVVVKIVLIILLAGVLLIPLEILTDFFASENGTYLSPLQYSISRIIVVFAAILLVRFARDKKVPYITRLSGILVILFIYFPFVLIAMNLNKPIAEALINMAELEEQVQEKSEDARLCYAEMRTLEYMDVYVGSLKTMNTRFDENDNKIVIDPNKKFTDPNVIIDKVKERCEPIIAEFENIYFDWSLAYANYLDITEGYAVEIVREDRDTWTGSATEEHSIRAMEFEALRDSMKNEAKVYEKYSSS